MSFNPETETADPSTLEGLTEAWLPFTPNRYFKQHPKVIVGAQGAHYLTSDGRRLFDALSGLWCCPIGHGHPKIAEVAVVGVADQLKGQVAMAFAIAKDTSGLTDAAARKALEAEVMKVVDSQLGAVARPSRVLFVTALPKTRSGKLLRRAIQAVAEGRDPGDLTTMDDPAALQQIVDLIKG